MSDLRTAKALATAAHPHAQTHGAEGGDRDDDRASGFIRSTVGTGAYDSRASGSVASFNTALTCGGGGGTSAYPPPTTSHLTASFSLSQSGGGANSWAMFHGAGGVTPSFGGVRNAVQVVMNRGAFAEGDGAARLRNSSFSRTVSLARTPVRAEQKVTATAAGAGGGGGSKKAAEGKLRRTQGLLAIKPTKGAEVEKKKPEGYWNAARRTLILFPR